MHPSLREILTPHTPESLSHSVLDQPGVGLFHSSSLDSMQTRYSFVCACPFLRFRAFGSRCELLADNTLEVQYGSPWAVLEDLLSRYELPDELDLPFPLGGCFGYWGYELKNFVEPKLGQRRAVNDLELADCWLGFYSSLVVFDHCLGKTWVISTGLESDGSRSAKRQRRELDFWVSRLHDKLPEKEEQESATSRTCPVGSLWEEKWSLVNAGGKITCNLSCSEFLDIVVRAQRYIRSGDIYQVNLSQRLAVAYPLEGWELFQALSVASPAPFAAYLDCGDFQLASSSPELFLRLCGSHITTRPIKGTRPRSADKTRDAQLAYELQTSAKEMAELVMITDLLRNDLGKICEFGSVQVPELVRLERYPQVQHLVSTVEGRLRHGVSHLEGLAACFPGGSITGAPKFRAMQIIDELEPNTRGPYTGVLGYVGFNRESQLSIIIRTALHVGDVAYFQVGAGIVADSVPECEYEETLAKARGFFEALRYGPAQLSRDLKPRNTPKVFNAKTQMR